MLKSTNWIWSPWGQRLRAGRGGLSLVLRVTNEVTGRTASSLLQNEGGQMDPSKKSGARHAMRAR